MVQRLSKIKYFIVLVVLLALPMLVMPTQANAGGGLTADNSFGVGQRLIDQTDMGEFRQVYYVDTRRRDTFVQITNTTTRAMNIHVQLFDVNNPVTECNQCNFDDMLTGEDTHVYDVKNMLNNITGQTECELPDGHYGFVVISFDNFKDGLGVCNGQRDCIVEGGPLIGMFRIIDESGYEYRTNSAGKEVLSGEASKRVTLLEEILVGPDNDRGRRGGWNMLVNFELADGNNLSDLVGITFWELDHRNVDASPLVGTTFGGDGTDGIEIYREDETMNSCDQTTFACGIGQMDKAIDNSLPNSLGQINQVCTTTRLPDNTSGWLHMPFSGFSCQPPLGNASTFRCNNDIRRNQFFVGFIGLNNGDGTGSMDSWWSERPENREKRIRDICCDSDLCEADVPQCLSDEI